MIKKAYVVGTGVSKSLSPTIFNYWFKKYNIVGEYEYVEIKEKNFDEEIQIILKQKDLCGLNITIPCKERIIPYLSDIDTDSKKIGAINCVTKNQLGLWGANTDWTGFTNSLADFKKINKKAIVVGYGGSAKAVIYALKKMKYKEIKVFNRTFKKIKNLKGLQPHELYDLPKYIKDADIVINTIPQKNFYTKKIMNTDDYKKNEKKILGYDLAYTEKTNFLEFFPHNRGISGINLLIHQAIPCFEKWFGKKPKIDKVVFEILIEKLKVVK